MAVILKILGRYPNVAFVKSNGFKANKEPILRYFLNFQLPLIVYSDNGAHWNSDKFPQFAQELCFRHDLITLRSASANAEVERVMGTISKA